MIIIFKNEKGTYSVRPAFIGFIKNNILRRSLCTLFYPLVVIVTIALNIVQVAFVCMVILVRAIYFPLKEFKPIWKTEIWNRPRTKGDANSRML